MRPLDDIEESRKHLLAGGIEQERGAPILAGAADGADEMAEQAARQFRRIQHRRAPGDSRRAPRRRSARCAARLPIALAGSSAARLRATRIPVVALHVLALLRHQRAAQRMAGARKAGQEAVTVAVHAHAAVRGHGGALGIFQPRIAGQPRRLALARQLDGLLRLDVPGMIQIQVRNLARQRLPGRPALRTHPPPCAARSPRPSPPSRARPTGADPRCWPSPWPCRNTP